MNRFQALIGRKSAQMEIHSNGIILIIDDDINQKIEIGFNSVKVTMGGENSNHFYLSNSNSPSEIISFQDENALEKLAASQVEGAERALEASKKRSRLRWAAWSSPVVLVISLIVFIPLMFSFVPIRWFNGVLSIEQERKLGEFILSANYSWSKETYSASPQEKSLSHLVDFIKEKNQVLKDLDFKVFISESKDLNAFALPGGIIVFNKGLIEKAQSIEEICGVLAHEMAHVELRHLLKSMVGSIGKLISVSVVGFFLGGESAGWFLRGSELVSLKYSRVDETEADMRGLEFLQNAKIDPMGLIAFFNRLNEETKLGSLSSHLSFLSTHPASEERINEIKNFIQVNPYDIRSQFPVQLEDLLDVNKK